VWNKLFDFGTAGGGQDGGTYDIFGTSWNDNTGVLEVQAYTALNGSYTGNAQLSLLPFLTPTVNTWSAQHTQQAHCGTHCTALHCTAPYSLTTELLCHSALLCTGTTSPWC
jgi:hypothetical protein